MLSERTGQKIVRQRQLADLGVQHLHVDHRFGRAGLRAEHVRRTFQELRSPLRDQVRMNVELLRQLRQRLLPFHGSQCHPRLRGGRLSALNAGL
jgi:hypothetical protein